MVKKKKVKKASTKDLSPTLPVSPLLPTSRNGVGRISMDLTKVSEQPKSSSTIKQLVAMKALKTKIKNDKQKSTKCV